MLGTEALLFNPFTAWPGRFPGHTVNTICPGPEDFCAVG